MQHFTATEFTAVNKDGRFTPAELETLAYMGEGKENAAIAMLRGHGTPGAKKLVASVMLKLNASTRTLAVARACIHGYIVAARDNPRHLAAALLIIASGWVGSTLPDSDVYRRGGTRSTSVRIGPRGPGRLEMDLNNWLGAA